MHANSLRLFHGYAYPHFTKDSVVLEVSPGEVSLQAPNRRWDTTGIVPNSSLTFLSEENHLAASDNSYDIVLSTNVLEHVRMPWVMVKEQVRVCRSGGLVINIVPANWPYHEDPIDCWRIFPDGMLALLKYAGLNLVECRGLWGDLTDEEKPHFYKDSLALDVIGVGKKP